MSKSLQMTGKAYENGTAAAHQARFVMTQRYTGGKPASGRGQRRAAPIGHGRTSGRDRAEHWRIRGQDEWRRAGVRATSPRARGNPVRRISNWPGARAAPSVG